MNRSLIYAFTLMAPALLFAAGEGGDAWYDILKTLLASVTALAGLILTVRQLAGTTPGSQKTKLEIEILKLDLMEKQKKQGVDSISAEPAYTRPQDLTWQPSDSTGTQLYNFSRLAIGSLAVLLPTILIVGTLLMGDHEFRPTLGDYYYSSMRDYYVGIHLVIAVLLLSYRGYAPIDFKVTKLQGIFCLLIGFSPVHGNMVLSLIHYGSSSLFFLLQAYIALFLFTRQGSVPTKKKRIQIAVYRYTAYTILIGLILLMLLSIVLPEGMNRLTFYLESLLYTGLGVAWLVKDSRIFFRE